MMKRLMTMRVLTKLANRHSSDGADGNIISALLIFPMIFFIGLAAVDAGMFFTNNTAINNAVRDGANNVAIVAGAGNPTRISVLEEGLFDTKSRAELEAGPAGWSDRGWRNITPRSSQDYLLMDTLANFSNVYRVDISRVACNVENRDSGGVFGHWVHSMNDRPYCRVDWRYDGMPFSIFGLFIDSSHVRTTAASVAPEVTLGTVNSCTNCDEFRRYTTPRP